MTLAYGRRGGPDIQLDIRDPNLVDGSGRVVLVWVLFYEIAELFVDKAT